MPRHSSLGNRARLYLKKKKKRQKKKGIRRKLDLKSASLEHWRDVIRRGQQFWVGGADENCSSASPLSHRWLPWVRSEGTQRCPQVDARRG